MVDAVESLAADQVLRICRDFWREFDLDGRRAGLDAQGLELQEAHRRTQAGRKTLQENTRAFKARPEPEKLASLGALMKLYQQEVDSLTRRARAADAAFFGLYKALYEAPDPTAALEAALAQASAAPAPAQEPVAGPARKDIEELEALREEIGTLKNQDVRVRKLEAELARREEEADAAVREKLHEREAELESVVAQRLGEVSERERQLEGRLAEMRAQLAARSSAADAAERRVFEGERRAEEAIAAARHEQALLAADAEDVEATRVALRAENDSLRRRLRELEDARALEAAAPGADADGSGGEAEIAQLMGIVSQERTEKDQLRLQVENLEAVRQRERKRHEAEVAALDAKAARLAEDLDARPSQEEFADVKRELQLLQQVEFNVIPDAEDEGAAEAAETGAAEALSTEKLLIRKARKLEGEMLAQRRRAEKAEAAGAELTTALRDARKLADDRQGLIRSLEDDLSAASSSSPTVGSSGKAEDATAAAAEEEAAALQGLLGGAPAAPSPAKLATPRRKTSGAGGQTPNDSALSIVTSQRDRFRSRIGEMEREMHALRERADGYEGKEKRLKSDNLALYEKIRYLQHQLNSAQGSGRDAYADAEAGAGPRAGGGPGAEVRYRGMYEASRDPFAAFTAVEKRRKMDELALSEKILLHMSGIFLKSKETRVFLFFYMLGLHGLVFFTTYYATHFCGSHLIGSGDHADLHGFTSDAHLPQGIDWDAHSEHVANTEGVQ
mmetsp:Transcript_19789/g.59934  ORF Transcript_19789/g.59934 Transcript_19789/m.59934 type:complete len:735 (-) Transcript_19789:314-2518(-)